MFPRLSCAALLAVLAAAACSPAPHTTTATKSPRTAVDPYAVQVMDAGPAQCGSVSGTDVARALATTNAQRGGAAPLAANKRLMKIAQDHACDMAARGRMTHIGSYSTGPGERAKATGYRYRMIAENIAAGPYDLDRVLAEWRKSPGHRDNLTHGAAREFGIGSAVGPDGKTIFWAAVYAAPQS